MVELARQTFVRGALGLIAGAALGACAPATSQPGASPAPTAAGGPDWRTLAEGIDGAVVLPADGAYGSAKRIFNARYDDSTPAAVVSVSSTDDVQKAMRFAADHALKVTPRCGGHSYIGASAADNALVLDLRGLPGGVSYDPVTGVATIAAGADLASVQTALAAFGRAIPTGSCPSVGVSGLTLGGGLGSDARRFGLSCDALVTAAVALPGGDMVTASPDREADLYWALRGGGGGSCGVVTSWHFRTFATADRDVVTMAFPESAAVQMISGWHSWLGAAGRSTWGMVNLTAGPDPGLRCSVVLATPAGAGPAAAADVRAAIGVAPQRSTVKTFGHLDLVHYFAGGSDATRPRAFVAGSDILGALTPATAEKLVSAMSAWPVTSGAATAVVESLDGAIGDQQPGDTAFPWRRQAACVQWYTEAPDIAAATAWLADAHAAVHPDSVGAYVNYVEPGVAPARYFGTNLDRWAAVRRRYDPSGLMYSALT